eukprot:gene11871-24874_t
MISLTFVERIENLKLVHYLNQVSYSQFKTQFIKKEEYDDENEIKLKFKKLKSYCSNVIFNKGISNREYKYATDTPVTTGGRLYSGGSIQGVTKKVRGYLMKHTTDIDMKNCHPVILQHICSTYGIKCDRLTFFNENREAVLSSFGGDRDDAKSKFLATINAKWTKKSIKHEFFNKFDREMKRIQKQLIQIKEFEDILQSIPNDEHHKKNIEGSFISRVMCSYENRILQVVIRVLNEMKIEICALMFDGLMVYGNYYENMELLKTIESEVEKEFLGLNMKFDYKQHDNKIIMPADFEPIEDYEDKQVYINFLNPATDKIKTIVEDCKYVSMKGTPHENNILSPEKLIVIHSYLGTGKTTAIKLLLNEKYKKARCLFISPRIAFSKFLINEFNAKCYIDMEAYEYQKHDKLIVSMESLNKLNFHESNYDLIILDECEANLSIFSSPTLSKKQLKTYNLLVELIKTSKKTIFATAFLTKKTVDFVEDLNEETVLIRNSTKPEGRKCIEVKCDDASNESTNETTMTDVLIKSIKKGEKNYVVFASKRALQSFQQELKARGKENALLMDVYNKMLSYHSECNDSLFDGLEKIVVEWGNASLVIVSPSITVGNSYKPEIPDFHNVFIYAFPSCVVADIFQSHKRVRELINNTVYYCLPSERILTLNKKLCPLKFKVLSQFDKQTATNKNDTIQLINNLIDQETKEISDVKYLEYLTVIKQSLENYAETPLGLRRLLLNNLLENTLSKRYYKEMFEDFLKFCNYENITNSAVLEMDTQANYNPLVYDIDLSKDYSTIENIDELQAMLIKKKIERKKATYTEKMKIDKFYFDLHINKDLPEERKKELYEIYSDKYNPFHHHLKNSKFETRSKIHVEDLFMETGAEFMNKKTQQLGIIKLLNKELGIENSLLKVTIMREKIEALNDYLFTNTEMIHNIFAVRNRNTTPKNDFKNSVSILNKIYGEWTSVVFKANTQGKENSIVSHTLCPKTPVGIDHKLACEEVKFLPYYNKKTETKTTEPTIDQEELNLIEEKQYKYYEEGEFEYIEEEEEEVFCEVPEKIKLNEMIEIPIAEPVMESSKCISVSAEPLNIVMEEMANLILEKIINYQQTPRGIPIIYRKTRASVDYPSGTLRMVIDKSQKEFCPHF